MKKQRVAKSIDLVEQPNVFLGISLVVRCPSFRFQERSLEILYVGKKIYLYEQQQHRG